MLFTNVVSVLFAGLAAAAPLEGNEAAAFEIDTRQVINPDLKILSTPVVSGTGCPPGTGHVIFDKDFQAFTVSFDKYEVTTGPAPLVPSNSVKGCRITIHLGYTKGLTFSVLTTDLEGFYNLEQGVRGKAVTDFSFTGGVGKPRWQHNFGPGDGQFDLHADPTLIVNSPCGSGSAIMNINTAISLSPLAPQPKKGLITASNIDGVLRQKFHIKWRKC